MNGETPTETPGEITPSKLGILHRDVNIDVGTLVQIGLLVFLMYFAFTLRLATQSTTNGLLLDYDPWWYFRHMEMIVKNNFVIPKWDIQSYWPPGRLFPTQVGYEYMSIFFWQIFSLVRPMELMAFVSYMPCILAALGVLAAYLFGRTLTNKWGGIATALFVIVTPTILSVSMFGYLDNDPVVLLNLFLNSFGLLYAIKKRTKFSYFVGIATTLLFATMWQTSWMVFFVFVGAVIGYIVVKNILSLLREHKLSIQKEDWWPYLKPLLIIGGISAAITFIPIVNPIRSVPDIFMSSQLAVNPIKSLLSGFGYLQKTLIVNISIAELQTMGVGVLSKDAIVQLFGRLSWGFLIALFIFPIVVAYLLWKKKMNFNEILVVTWFAISLWLAGQGFRFALELGVASAMAAGYVVGKFTEIGKESFTPKIYIAALLGGMMLFAILTLNDGNIASQQMGGMQIDQSWVAGMNWLKTNAQPQSLLMTWWDPGHILAGYTGLNVMADGAHCGPDECKPYSINERIQDMGKIMSTDNETEAINIIKHYVQLTPEQCAADKQYYGNAMPDSACNAASEIYFLATNDLIGKFTWMNYFGGYGHQVANQQDFLSNPGQCQVPNTEGTFDYCPWGMSAVNATNEYIDFKYGSLDFYLYQKNSTIIPVYAGKYVIDHLAFYQATTAGSQLVLRDYSNYTAADHIGGLMFVDPNFQSAIYLNPQIENSMYVRMFFFDGQGLTHFKQVFSNGEVKIYKVVF